MGRAGTPDTPRLATAAAIRRVRRSGPPHREDHGRRRETARAMSHMPHDGARSVGPRHPARRRPRPRRGRRQRGGKRRGLILGGGRGDVVPHAVRGTQARASSADSMSIASRYPVVNLISAMSQPPRARRDRVGPIGGTPGLSLMLSTSPLPAGDVSVKYSMTALACPSVRETLSQVSGSKPSATIGPYSIAYGSPPADARRVPVA